MSKLLITQTKFLLKQREAVITFCMLIWFILINYLGNVSAFRGRDITQMYYPYKMMTLSYNRVNYNAEITMLLIMLYPVLVSLPAGFAYLKEEHTNEQAFIITRIGKEKYIWLKLWTAFATTAIVFCTPFLLETLLYTLSFPMKAENDFSHLGRYQPEYAQMVHHYLGSTLYLHSPELYTVIMTLVFGMISGLLGVLPVAVSLAFPVRFRVLLLLPVYLLLNMTNYIRLMRDGVTCSWYDYLLLFQDEPKNIWFLMIGTGVVLVLIVGLTLVGRKREMW